MTRAAAFSPCNITGFFQIHTDSSNPLRTGSKGASVALSTGVTTRVSVRKERRSTVCASFNGRPLPKNSVSAYVARRYIELDGKGWSIDITHSSPLPTGCGYGTSGAGALSLSFALNEAMSLSLDRLEVAQMAHIAEIACKTGLGTVTSVSSGGLTLRTVPGAPGVGKTTRISVPRAVRLVTATFGPIATSRVLGSDDLRKRVNTCGKELVDSFDKGHLEISFMELSRKFSDCLDLWSHRLGRLIGRLNSIGFRSSMVMLGESVFCMAPSEEAEQIASILQGQGLTPTVSTVARSGAHLL
jgi:pantoate kinase